MKNASFPDVLRWILTLATVGLLVWWLMVVLGYLGTPAVKDDKSGIVTDVYGRAKETLAVIVPFVTLALGYWFGAKGTDDAKQEASTAKEKVEKLTSVTDEAKYAELANKYPKLFGTSSE